MIVGFIALIVVGSFAGWVLGRWSAMRSESMRETCPEAEELRWIQRANNKLHEIDVSPNEIDLLWDFGEKDVVKRVHGRWQYVITYIVVGRQKV